MFIYAVQSFFPRKQKQFMEITGRKASILKHLVKMKLAKGNFQTHTPPHPTPPKKGKTSTKFH